MNKIASLPFFPGFYETFLSGLIDDEIEQSVDHDGITLEECLDLYDASAASLAISRAWVEAFNEKTGLSLRFESMQSPKEYNFTTDRVFVEIVSEDFAKLKVLIGGSVFKKVLKDKFTSYDGFASFYSSNPEDAEWQKPFDEWDHNQLEALIQTFVLSHITDNIKDFLQTLYYRVCDSDAVGAGWSASVPQALKTGEELTNA